MGIDAGFDMYPRLSKGIVDRQNWGRFIDFIKEYYKDDTQVEIEPNYINFKAGEHPKLPFEGHKFLRFSSKVSGSTAADTKVDSYIDTVTRIARTRFGSRIRYWHEGADEWQRKIGWMFWGCISGKYGKGSRLFWEKEWKSITQSTYCEHTFPVVWNYMYTSGHPGLYFQQDGGPGHTAKFSMAYMADRGIVPIFWPPFSPDLSPIETMWKRMKDILSALDPEVHRNYKRLRAAVLEAWNSITDAEVRDMIHTMGARCTAVKNAHGMYTEF